MSEQDFKDFLALVELQNQCCMLDHKDEKYVYRQAVDFVCQETVDGMLRVPICLECQEALDDKAGKWMLFYCLSCNCSQWLDKEKSRHDYGLEKLRWFNICPKCTE